jgi:hypothetical protein
MLLETTYLNRTENYRVHDERIDLKDTYNLDDNPTVGDIFREMVKEHGRCTGKVYVDYLHRDSKYGPYPVGWVFQKRVKYDDCKETYLQEVWVTLLDKYETKIIRELHPIAA